MSRSRKKTPQTGITTAESEKDNKRKANRIFRRATKAQLKKGDSQFVSIKEVSNVWLFDKDGKQFLKNATKRDLRK
jgi:4-aminobutyrate aminotransferase-like enzyme